MTLPKDPQKREEYLRNVSARTAAWHAANRGTEQYEEWRRNVGEAAKGKHPNFTMKDKHHSQETKDKQSASQKDKPRWSEEDKIKMSTKRQGHKLSPESIAKRTAKQKGLKRSEVTKARLTASLNRPESIAKRSAGLKAHFASLTPEEQTAYVKKRYKSGKNKDTTLEVYIARRLEELGIDYEPQKFFGRYVVDFFVPDQNLVIEAMGCFWHYCEQCGYNGEGSEKRRERDQTRRLFLESKGYTVVFLWEHDLRLMMKAKLQE